MASSANCGARNIVGKSELPVTMTSTGELRSLTGCSAALSDRRISSPFAAANLQWQLYTIDEDMDVVVAVRRRERYTAA